MATFFSRKTAIVSDCDSTSASAASSGDVKNADNSTARWARAILYFSQSCETLREGDTGERCRVNAVIDVSGSMDRSKLTAVKLGICSLVANLKDTDELNITAFSGRCKPITGGFRPVLELKESTPTLLQRLRTDGCTACYDAIIAGVKDLRGRCREAASPEAAAEKNIVIALTDGADNESRHKASHVLRHICSPGIPNFMFMMVAADMQAREERSFHDWMDITHCKQVSVSVKTGTKLVSVFKETLLSRILQSGVDSGRFLQTPGEGIDDDISSSGPVTADDASFSQLLGQLARRVRPAGQGEDEEDDCDCDSVGISRESSVSDGQDCRSDDDDDDDDTVLSWCEGEENDGGDVVIGVHTTRSLSISSDDASVSSVDS